jgi:hypothetical protein
VKSKLRILHRIEGTMLITGLIITCIGVALNNNVASIILITFGGILGILAGLSVLVRFNSRG